jgi:hypothetical protein
MQSDPIVCNGCKSAEYFDTGLAMRHFIFGCLAAVLTVLTASDCVGRPDIKNLASCLNQLGLFESREAVQKQLDAYYGAELLGYLECGCKVISETCSVLRVSMPAVRKATYFVFIKNPEKFGLIGNFQVDNYGAENISHFISADGIFIGVPVYSHGTGCSDDFEKWFHVTKKGIKEALNIPLKGYRYGWHLSYDATYKCSELRIRNDSKKTYLEQDVSVTFFAGHCESCGDYKSTKMPVIFTKNSMAVYEWSTWKRRWVISGSSELKGENPYDAMGVWDENGTFLNKHHVALLDMAKRADPKQSCWLKCFIDLKAVKGWGNRKHREKIAGMLNK